MKIQLERRLNLKICQDICNGKIKDIVVRTRFDEETNDVDTICMFFNINKGVKNE